MISAARSTPARKSISGKANRAIATCNGSSSRWPAVPCPPQLPDLPAYVAPEIKPEDIRPGEIKETQFKNSMIFPGTIRDVTVFIPAQYDGSKPACVYVKTDGYHQREKSLMETMIATGEMPVTIRSLRPVPGPCQRRWKARSTGATATLNMMR
ncbi:MAG: hypothetical protein R3F31_12770 [Verrucomicrobiales bacterium]